MEKIKPIRLQKMPEDIAELGYICGVTDYFKDSILAAHRIQSVTNSPGLEDIPEIKEQEKSDRESLDHNRLYIEICSDRLIQLNGINGFDKISGTLREGFLSILNENEMPDRFMTYFDEPTKKARSQSITQNDRDRFAQIEEMRADMILDNIGETLPNKYGFDPAQFQKALNDTVDLAMNDEYRCFPFTSDEILVIAMLLIKENLPNAQKNEQFPTNISRANVIGQEERKVWTL